ncbi:MAG: ABC transporter substrate-binding protein [Parvibaculaceae bacterium]
MASGSFAGKTQGQGPIMDRRKLLAGMAAAGLTLAGGGRLAAEEAASQPKKGGHLRVGLAAGSTTDSLDPGTYSDRFMQTVGWGGLSNSLTEVDALGAVVPDIAQSFESADNARKWIFRLRKGIVFHDGRDLEPADVIASFRHHMKEGSKSSAWTLLTHIADIKADGANVIFELKAGHADFPYIVGDYRLPIMPRSDTGDADWQSGNRTGPFALDHIQYGIGARLKRNERYHREVWFDSVEVLAIQDTTARLNALQTGEVDYIDRVDLKTLALLKRNPAIAIDAVAGYGHYGFAMNVTRPPFDRPEVRRALKLAIDRNDILQKVLYGYGSVGNDNPIAPSVPFAVNPQPVHSYDPDQARHILKSAGLDSLKLDLSTSETAFSGAVEAALLFKASAAAANIDVNVVREANDGYWDNVWLKKDFCATYWAGRPTCDLALSYVYAADAPWNETSWRNPRFNELLADARDETDAAVRARMYAEMQQLIHDDGGFINIMFNNYVTAHSTKLGHGPIAPNYEVDGFRLYSRWWLK